MENLTLTDFQTTLVVILAVFSAIVVIDKGIASFKKIFFKTGNDVEKRIKLIEEKQARDYVRINDIDKQMHRSDTDMEHMLNSINAILMHEITGNGVEQLKREKNDLDSYMSKRGTNARFQRDDLK